MGRYLVTGGAGFIGSNIVRALLKRGDTVRVLDNLSTGRWENLAEIRDQVEFHEGDIRNPDHCRQACQNVEVVFHEAAVPSVPVSMEEPRLTHEANVDGVFNMLMAAREAKVRRLVYAASSSCYGESEVSPKVESLPLAPISPYGAQKAIGELYLTTFYRAFGLQTISLRYFNVFGPRQNPKSQYAAVVPAFITTMLDGQAPTVHGDGLQSRDFTFIDNVVAANLLAADARETHGEVVNIACGDSISVISIVDEVNAVLGTQIKPIHTPTRAGDIRHSCADISLAKKVLGFAPQVTFRQGLEQTVAWYRRNRTV